jgi:hypothetical protein
MNGEGKMTFEVAIEKLMREFLPEKFTRNIPREKNEEWIALDDKVKRVAIIQKRSADIIWEDIARKIEAKDIARFVNTCHYRIGMARKTPGLGRSGS